MRRRFVFTQKIPIVQTVMSTCQSVIRSENKIISSDLLFSCHAFHVARLLTYTFSHSLPSNLIFVSPLSSPLFPLMLLVSITPPCPPLTPSHPQHQTPWLSQITGWWREAATQNSHFSIVVYTWKIRLMCFSWGETTMTQWRWIKSCLWCSLDDMKNVNISFQSQCPVVVLV